MLFKLLILLVINLFVSVAYALELNISVFPKADDNKAIEQNVRGYLAFVEDLKADDVHLVKNQLNSKVQTALQALGYYQANVELEVTADKALSIDITKNDPVRIRDISIVIEGEAIKDKEFKYISPFEKGAIFHHGEFDSFKTNLTNLALSRGYFFAEFKTKKATINKTLDSIDIDFIFDTEVRYNFGDLTGNLTEKQIKMLSYLLPYEPGEPFTSEKLAQLSNQISSSKYFKSFELQPNLENIKSRNVPIDFKFDWQTKTQSELIVGYDTEKGAKIGFSFEKPLINSRGDQLEGSIDLAQKEQKVELAYKIPRHNINNNYYYIGAHFEQKEYDYEESLSYGVELNWYKKLDSGWERWIGVDLEQNVDTEIDDREVNSLHLIPYINLKKRRMALTKGHAYDFSFKISNESWGSDSSFAQFYAKTKWMKALDKEAKHRVFYGLEQGVTIADDIGDIPISYRYLSGGDNSIRGYAYDSIYEETTTESGSYRGTKYLTTATVEYDYEYAPNWRAAFFVDVGTATNDYNNAKWHIGLGPGIRYSTDFGDVRLDTGVGISNEDLEYQIHFSFGAGL